MYVRTYVRTYVESTQKDTNGNVHKAYFKDWKYTLRHAASSPGADKSNIGSLQK